MEFDIKKIILLFSKIRKSPARKSESNEMWNDLYMNNLYLKKKIARGPGCAAPGPPAGQKKRGPFFFGPTAGPPARAGPLARNFFFFFFFQINSWLCSWGSCGQCAGGSSNFYLGKFMFLYGV